MNLTPTQKADELIEKFRNFDVTVLGCGNPSNPCIISEKMFDHSATQCAIIAVDEIIDNTEVIWFESESWTNELREIVKFWQEVKQILTDRL